MTHDVLAVVRFGHGNRQAAVEGDSLTAKLRRALICGYPVD